MPPSTPAGRQVRALGAVSPVIIVRAECGLVFRGLTPLISRESLDGALPLLPLEFFRHYWQYGAGRFSEFRGVRGPAAMGGLSRHVEGWSGSDSAVRSHGLTIWSRLTVTLSASRSFLDFSHTAGLGTAITAVRVLSALLAVRRRALFGISRRARA
jgi:hypothetical protein